MGERNTVANKKGLLKVDFRLNQVYEMIYLKKESYLGFPGACASWIAAVFVAITPAESLIRAAS